MSSPVYQPAIQPEHDDPTVLDALRSSPAGPFLDLPLPQLPQLPAAQLPQLPTFAAPQAPMATNLPPLPPNPLDTLLQGISIPALPGIDQLLKPLLDLASGFGSGVLGRFDPTQIFEQASSALDGAMQLGQTGLKGLDQAWQGGAAQNAQSMGQSAQASGAEVSKRGQDISAITRDAAASVERGNIKLAGIVQSFVTTAVAAAPVIFTPPGQAMLLASAADHLGQAMAVVAQTRGELTTHTAHMTALTTPIGVAPGPGPVAPGQSPFAAASQAIDQGRPIVDSATKSVEGVVQGIGGANPDGSTSTASYSDGHAAGSAGGGAAHTSAASALSGGGGGMGGGAGGLGMLGGGAAGGVGRSALGSSATGGVNGSPAATPGGPLGAGGPVGTGTPGMGGMGSMMGGAGRGANNDTEHNTPSYLNSPVNNSDVVGELPRVVSPVIGAPDPDEYDDIHDDYLD